MKKYFIIAAVGLLFSCVGAAQAKTEKPNPADVDRGAFVHYPRAKGGGNSGGSGDQVNDFKYSGVHWGGTMPVVSYLINPQNDESIPASDIISATQLSFQTWMENDHADSTFIAFNYEGTTPIETTANPSADGFNTVSFEPLSSSYPNAIAITFYWYNRFSKELIETDTVFNSDFPWVVNIDPLHPDTGKYDFQDIATHEFGHWLVLNDLYNQRDSQLTMYGYGSLGETWKRSLGKGDITGINKIY